VEVVEVLLKITLATKAHGVVVQKAHRTLVFLGSRCDMSRRGVRGDIA
jgi:hypothetical protein